ncbi:MAG: metal ABC transporter substrate-binding protein [Akkermansia sp.]
MIRLTSVFFALLCACFLSMPSHAEVKLTALHPILGNMARQIGGDKVLVVDLLKANGNLHTFEPSPKEIATAAGSKLVLASGKQMEPYLDSLRDTLSSGSNDCSILELGANIPDVPSSQHEENKEEEHKQHEHSCCHHANDPHWWHTPSNMKRAARLLYSSLLKIDPTHAEQYKKNLSVWNKKMDSLDAWARIQLADIPTDKKILVTGHAAMSHFCKEYGFHQIPIQGISREDESNPARLASTLQKLRQLGIPVIFPEYSANPKSLEEIAKTLNIPLGQALITDGLSPDTPQFEDMFRKNVLTIKQALSK